MQYRTCPEKPTLLKCSSLHALFWEKKLRGQHLLLVQNKESTDLPKGSSSSLLSVTEHITRAAPPDHTPSTTPHAPAALASTCSVAAAAQTFLTVSISSGTPHIEAAQEHRFMLCLQQGLQEEPLCCTLLNTKTKDAPFPPSAFVCNQMDLHAHLYLHVFISSVSLIVIRGVNLLITFWNIFPEKRGIKPWICVELSAERNFHVLCCTQETTQGRSREKGLRIRL